MKKLILIFIAAVFIGCSSTGVQVTFDDEKSNAIRAHYQNYLNNDVEALQSLWSPDLNIYINSTEAAGVEDISTAITAQHMVFENINMWLPGTDDGTGGGLHTTYYDEFGTWTHYWGTWTGTGKFTGNEVTQFIHLNYGWNEEGKIFYHNVHIDGKDFLAEVNAAQAASGSE